MCDVFNGSYYNIADNEEETPHFFVDTTGTNDLHASVNTTLNSNSKKMKNKKNSICLADNELNDGKNLMC